MDITELQSSAMQIIIKAGDGRRDTYRAIDALELGDTTEVATQMEAAGESIKQAHIIHTKMIQAEAQGEELGYSMLFTHAQDTLMTAYSEYRLVKKLLPVLEQFDARIKALEDKK